jgi:DNA-binding FadR family transcriptional regulator
MSFEWKTLATTTVSVPNRIAAELEKLIIEGKLAIGEKLPAERDLAENLGVSRASLRDALHILELRGLLTRRQGRGTIVTGDARPELRSSLFGDMSEAARLITEVMDLRAVIEPPITARAAARARSVDLERLEDFVTQAERELESDALDIPTLMKLDIEFHIAIAEATHNPFLRRLLEVTVEWMQPSRREDLQTRERLQRSIQAHREIYMAIRESEVDHAQEAMASHVQQIHDVIRQTLLRDDGHRQ